MGPLVQFIDLVSSRVSCLLAFLQALLGGGPRKSIFFGIGANKPGARISTPLDRSGASDLRTGDPKKGGKVGSARGVA